MGGAEAPALCEDAGGHGETGEGIGNVEAGDVGMELDVGLGTAPGGAGLASQGLEGWKDRRVGWRRAGMAWERR